MNFKEVTIVSQFMKDIEGMEPNDVASTLMTIITRFSARTTSPEETFHNFVEYMKEIESNSMFKEIFKYTSEVEKVLSKMKPLTKEENEK